MSQVLDPVSFNYLGGEGPLEGHLLPRAQGLALRAVEALGAGTGGYIGVDLILGDSADGSKDMVIEVNPRLTTSYIGIRQLVTENLLQMILDLSRGRSVTYGVKPGQLRFTHEGHVWKAQ
jgi:hypothetical protein